MPTDPTRDFLRHTVATLAYRAGRVCQDAPPGFAEFRARTRPAPPGRSSPTWATYSTGPPGLPRVCLRGDRRHRSRRRQETDRFFAALARLDAVLAAGGPIACPLRRPCSRGRSPTR